MDPGPHQRDDLDLAYSIRGMHRILDLIPEQGSGGLVDKIIISQDSLKAFINSVFPGAYVSMTDVNFEVLHKYVVKPVGVYGSKEEIVRFLLQLNAVDETIAAQLLADSDTHLRTQPTLRSGLYIITTPEQTDGPHQMFVLYWPEQTTWDDSAASFVRRNRITFMRYMTKMCDQVVSLISPEHARTIIWNESDKCDGGEAQTNKQEELVTVRKGFKVVLEAIALPEAPTKDSDPTKPMPITPFLLFGETTQGLMTVEHQEVWAVQETLERRSIEATQLEALLQWKQNSTAVRTTSDADIGMEIMKARVGLLAELPAVLRTLFEATLDEVLRLHPYFDREEFIYHEEEEVRSVGNPGPISELPTLYPRGNNKIVQQLRTENIQDIRYQDFQTTEDRSGLVDKLPTRFPRKRPKLDKQTYPWDHIPPFKVPADTARQEALNYLEGCVARTAKKLALEVNEIREEEYAERIKQEYGKMAELELEKLRGDLINHVNDSSTWITYTHMLSVDNVEVFQKQYDGLCSSTSYLISGSRASQQDHLAVYTVHPMKLTTEAQHSLHLSPSAAIPSPEFQFGHTFTLPLGHSVVWAQLLEGNKLMLVVVDRVGNLGVYLDRPAGMDGAIARGRRKPLDREMIGQEFLLAYDESKKMLAVVSSDRLLLHIFVFDDARGFQSLGGAINLHLWYKKGSSIRRVCFVSGNEEVVLVDSQARVRVFCLVTLQFRPATLQLSQVPYSVSSTPNGACLLVAQARGSDLAVTAYHWSTFGSTDGVLLNLSPLSVKSGPVVTSLISRAAVHVVVLDFDAHECRSHALDITCKATELTFKERDVRGSSTRLGVGAGGNMTTHNCLIDCHTEIWTYFPAFPVERCEIISSTCLQSVQKLLFVTDRDYPRYARHFAEMILAFEKATRASTGDILKSIQISSASFSVFATELCGGGEHPNSTADRACNVSAYHASKWFVDLLCLIPIQLALHKSQCEALYAEGRIIDAALSLLGITNTLTESVNTNKSIMNWRAEFTNRCTMALERVGDMALDAEKQDDAATAYSVALSLSPSTPNTTLNKWASAVLIHSSVNEALSAATKFKLPMFAIYRAICDVLEGTGRVTEAVKCFQQMECRLPEATNPRDERARWKSDFLEKLGDAAMNAKNHDAAIKQYSDALTLDPTNKIDILVKRGKARALEGSWEGALIDADEAIELDPASHKGYELKHAALHSMGRYREAFRVFLTMLLTLKESPDSHIRELRDQYVDATAAIQSAIQKTLRDMPRVLIDATTGRLYDKTQQGEAFEELPIYQELRSSMTTIIQLDHTRIRREVKKFYRYVMLSHKWQPSEPTFQVVKDISIYGLPASPTNSKLQGFCKLAHSLSFQWAWSDTCCVDQLDRGVQQESVVAMFRWYRGSSLTIVHLLGVASKFQQPGHLWRSIWNTRGWTYQEYVAAKTVQFYTEDWKPYLGLTLFNHKESPAIISEMQRATGVSAQEMAVLSPGLERVREKLYLASMRQTTREEDMAYSLFGIFGVAIPVIYGEGNQAVGRLLEHILPRSDDVTLLAWTGSSGSDHSYLPVDLTVYNQIVPPHIPRVVETDEMDSMVMALRSSLPELDLSPTIELYDRLYDLPSLSLVSGQLKLPGIVFPLTGLILSASDSESDLRDYRGTTHMLGDVEIKTTYDLSGMKGLLLIHPWISPLIDLDFSYGEAQADRTMRALRLVVRLRQPFGALLLAPTRRMQYRRVATDSLIMVQIRETSVAELMDGIRTIDVQ